MTHASPLRGRIVVRAGLPFSGVKVFTATDAAERERLGERVCEWLESHATNELVEVAVTQSNDSSSQCLTITVFYADHTASLRHGQ